MRKFLAGFLVAHCAPLDLILKPIVLFAFRFYTAYVFIKSGLSKVDSNYQVTSSTIDLFKYEYEVPFFPPELAAYLATYAELILPILLILGIFTRPAALGLFILNFIAAISYPDMSTAGHLYHVIWGLMLLVVFAFGPGNFSFDKWISNKLYGKDGKLLSSIIPLAILTAIGYFLATKFL